MGKGDRSKCQSTKLCLFVGFLTLSVDFERLKFLVLAVFEGWDDSSDPGEPQKKAEMGTEFVGKKEEKNVGREERYQLQRVVGASGVRFSIMRNRKQRGRREGRGRKGESVVTRLLPRLRRAAALLSGRRGG